MYCSSAFTGLGGVWAYLLLPTFHAECAVFWVVALFEMSGVRTRSYQIWLMLMTDDRDAGKHEHRHSVRLLQLNRPDGL